MSEENRKDDPGTDPETQRQEITRRGYAPHPAHERPRTLNTTRPREGEETPPDAPDDEKAKQGASSPR